MQTILNLTPGGKLNTVNTTGTIYSLIFRKNSAASMAALSTTSVFWVMSFVTPKQRKLSPS